MNLRATAPPTPRSTAGPTRPAPTAHAILGTALVLSILVAITRPAPAVAATCTYTGTSSYNGRLTATVTDTETSAALQIDVRIRLDATPWHLWPVQFLAQELSTYRNGTLQSVAINGRWSSGGTLRRQYWDVFTPSYTGLIAQRIQVKRESDLERRHPSFAPYWNPATFAQPWLPTFNIAAPDRRPDLDLPTAQIPPGLKPPLALALYWSRQPLAPTIPIFLPGWKHDARLTGTTTHTGQTTRLTLPHPALSPASFIETTQNPHALHLQAETTAGDGEATLIQTHCE